MHIPDGYLGPQTYVALDAAMVPIWAIAAAKVKKTLKAKQVPLMALGAAFSFVIMMFNVPVLGGTTGHAVGATLIAILLGPWAAVISVSIALVIQALLFGDGGVTALGANCFNMAVVMPFVGYYVYRLFAGDAPSFRRRVLSAGAGSYAGIVTSSIVAGVEFGLQPILAHTATGQPLYAPYPMQVAVPAMALGHILFFGPVEAVVTMGVVAALARSDSALLEMKPAARPLRWLWGALAALILLAPVGVLAPGTAWGEWNAAQLNARFGYVPAGFERLSHTWTAAMPGYAPAFIKNPLAAYLFAAVIGATIIIALTWAAGALLLRGESAQQTAQPVAPLPAAPSPARTRAGSTRRTRRSFASRAAAAIGSHVSEVLENEELAARPGLLQRIEPRVKLLSLLLFSVTASLVRSIPVLLAMVALTLVLAAASRVSVGSFARKVWGGAGVLTAILVAPATTAFITPGAPLVVLGPLTLTVPGVLGAITLLLRVASSAGVALLLVWTMRWTDLLGALSALKVPDVIVATLAMTQQQIVSLMRTVQQMHLARESRTLTQGTAAQNRDWVVGRMAFVVQKSVKTADDVYDAMLARGFTGRVRTLHARVTSASTWVPLVAAGAICLSILGLDRLVWFR